MNTSALPDHLPARMLNEFAYCPRLFHLEWVQQEWADNHFTLDGRRVHKRVDQPLERAKGHTEPDESPSTVRSLDLSDDGLRLVAKIDLAELDGERAVPVDYKRGRLPATDEGAWEPERVQICAQALLLRARGYTVEEGVLYFAGSKRRVVVPISPELVARTLELRDAAFLAASSDEAPPVLEDQKKCVGCSLSGICLPEEQALLQLGRKRDKLREVRARSIESYPVHITEPGSVVRKVGDELSIEPREGEPTRIRLVDVSNVQVHGSSKLTAPAIQALMGAGATISHLSRGGWLYGRTRGPSHKNVLLRIAQFEAARDADRSLALGKVFVAAKIRNGRTLVRRHGEEEAEALAELDRLARRTVDAESAASLLGLEGHAAKVYFRAFARVLARKTNGAIQFDRRDRRPAPDPANALLSFLYGMLTTAWTEVVDRVGFDAYLGFYHQPRYGKPALALDLMEAFRPIIADSCVLSLLSRGRIDEADFVRTPTSCALSKAGRRRAIQAFETRMDEQIVHPTFGYRISYRQVFEVQARLLGRVLQGELETYPEFIVR